MQTRSFLNRKHKQTFFTATMGQWPLWNRSQGGSYAYLCVSHAVCLSVDQCV